MNRVIFLCFCLSVITALNNSPVIGILTIPSDDDYTQYPSSKYSYFAASYVKYVESSGARVLPIPYEADETTLEAYFNQVNGIVLTGGSLALETESGESKYLQTVRYILNKVIKENEKDVFPLLAICLGHQTLHFILSNKDYSVLQSASGLQRVSKKLTIQDATSSFLKELKTETLTKIQQEEIIYFNTNWGVLPSYYEQHQELNDFFKIVALNSDSKQQEMIAAAEGKNYPIFSVGFHPEKPIFEYKVAGQHHPQSIQFGRNIMNQFIQYARQSSHVFTATESLIFQYNPVQLSSASFAQLYFFELGEKQYQSFKAPSLSPPSHHVSTFIDRQMRSGDNFYQSIPHSRSQLEETRPRNNFSSYYYESENKSEQKWCLKFDNDKLKKQVELLTEQNNKLQKDVLQLRNMQSDKFENDHNNLHKLMQGYQKKAQERKAIMRQLYDILKNKDQELEDATKNFEQQAAKFYKEMEELKQQCDAQIFLQEDRLKQVDKVICSVLNLKQQKLQELETKELKLRDILSHKIKKQENKEQIDQIKNILTFIQKEKQKYSFLQPESQQNIQKEYQKIVTSHESVMMQIQRMNILLNEQIKPIYISEDPIYQLSYSIKELIKQNQKSIQDKTILQEELQTLTNKINKIDQYKQVIEQKNTQINQLKNELKVVNHQIQKQETINQLNDCIKKQSQQIELLNQQINEQNKMMEQNDTLVLDLQIKIKEKSEELKQIKCRQIKSDQADLEESTKSQQLISQLSKENQSLNEQIEIMYNEQATLQQQIEEKDLEIQQGNLQLQNTIQKQQLEIKKYIQLLDETKQNQQYQLKQQQQQHRQAQQELMNNQNQIQEQLNEYLTIIENMKLKENQSNQIEIIIDQINQLIRQKLLNTLKLPYSIQNNNSSPHKYTAKSQSPLRSVREGKYEFDCQKIITTLDMVGEQYQSKISQLNKKDQKSQESLTHYCKQIEESQLTIQELCNENETLKNNIEQIFKQLNVNNLEEIQGMQSQQQIFQDTLNKNNTQISQLLIQNQTYQNDIKQLKIIVNDYEIQITHLKSQIDLFGKENQDNVEFQIVSPNSSSRRGSIIKLMQNEEIQNKDAQISQLNQTNSILNQQIEKQKQELNKNDIIIQEQLEQTQQLNKQIQELQDKQQYFEQLVSELNNYNMQQKNMQEVQVIKLDGCSYENSSFINDLQRSPSNIENNPAVLDEVESINSSISDIQQLSPNTQIKQIISSNKQQEEIVCQLKKNLIEKQSEIEKLYSQEQLLKQQLLTNEQFIKQKQEEYQNLEIENQQLHKQLKDKIEQLNLLNKLDEQNSKNEINYKKIEQLEIEKLSLNSQLNNFQQTITQLEINISQLYCQKSKLFSKLHKSKQFNINLIAQFKRLKQYSESIKNQCKEDLMQTITIINQQLITFQSTFSNLISESYSKLKKEQQQNIKCQENEIQNLECTIIAIQSQFENQKNQLLEFLQKIITYQDNLQQMDQNLNQRNNELMEIKLLNIQINEENTKYKQLQQQMESDQTLLQQKIEQLTEKNLFLNEQMTKTFNQQQNDNKIQQDNQYTLIMELRQQIISGEENKKKIENQIQQDLQKQNELTQSIINQNQEIKKLQEITSNSNIANTKLEKQIMNLQEQLVNLELNKQQLLQQKNLQQLEVEELNSQLQEIQQQLKQEQLIYEKNEENFQQENNKLKQSIQELQIINTNLLNQIENQKQQITKKISESEINAGILENQLKSEQNEKLILQEEVQQIVKQNKELTETISQNTDLQKQFENLNKLSQQQQQEIQKQLIEISQFKEQEQCQINKIEQLEQQLQKQQNIYEQLKLKQNDDQLLFKQSQLQGQRNLEMFQNQHIEQLQQEKMQQNIIIQELNAIQKNLNNEITKNSKLQEENKKLQQQLVNNEKLQEGQSTPENFNQQKNELNSTERVRCISIIDQISNNQSEVFGEPNIMKSSQNPNQKILTLQNELSSLYDQNAQLKRQQLQSLDDIIELSPMKESDAISKLKNEIDILKQDGGRSKYELQNEIIKLEQKIVIKDQQLQSLEKSSSFLLNMCQKAQNNDRDWMIDLNTMNQDQDIWRDICQRLQQYEQQQNEILQLTNQITELQEQLKNLENGNLRSIIMNQVNQQQSQSIDLDDMFSMRSTVTKLKQDLDQQRQNNQKMKSYIKSFEQDEERFQQQNQRMKEEGKQQLNRINELKEEIKQLNDKLSNCQGGALAQHLVSLLGKFFEAYSKENKQEVKVYYQSIVSLCQIEYNEQLILRLQTSLDKKSQGVFSLFKRDKSKDK